CTRECSFRNEECISAADHNKNVTSEVPHLLHLPPGTSRLFSPNLGVDTLIRNRHGPLGSLCAYKHPPEEQQEYAGHRQQYVENISTFEGMRKQDLRGNVNHPGPPADNQNHKSNSGRSRYDE